MKKIIILLFTVTTLLFSQTSKISNQIENKINVIEDDEKILVWIYFNSKDGKIENLLENPANFISEKALLRRSKNNNINLDFTDLQISKSNLNTINNLGIEIKQKSKWLNAISCFVSKEQIKIVEKLDNVKKISEVRRFRKKIDKKDFNEELTNGNIVLPQNVNYTLDYGNSLTQNEVINTAAVHDLGYSGKGILICVMDAGFDQLTHEAFENLNIVDAWDFVNNDADVEDGSDAGEGSHGTATLSLLGGFKEGELIGTSYGADFILAKTENTDSETPLEEDNWIAAAEWADNLGADIFSTSLGYLDFESPYESYTYDDMDGNTAAITIAADLAVKKGIVVFNSAGNNGSNSSHNTLSAPADGDSVIAIGAVYSSGSRVYFCSVGPTADNRIKPDFMAMGSGTYAASNSSDQSYNSSFSGTSAACPLAAGVAALLLEKNYNLTPIEIREILRNTSSNSTTPNKFMGWGIIDALSAIQEIPEVKVQLKIMLEGSYDSLNNAMKIDLLQQIPLQSPYISNARRIKSIPNNIVDWVLVELRETINGPTIASKSALLHKDGRIVSDDANSDIITISAIPGDYYVVIKHRNHLPIISSNSITFTSE